MPLYEYVCPDCEVKFERLVSMADGHAAECPTCGTPSDRILSVFAAFSSSAGGEVASLAGGSCACSTGGACGCSGGF